MFISTVFGFKSIGDAVAVDFRGLIIFAILLLIASVSKLYLKKKPTPILMIILSAVLGILLYGM